LDLQAVLDPACPWCFIGLRRLQRALGASPDVAVSLRFVPYVFDPDTPSPPLRWREYVALRYPERAHAIYTQKLPYTLSQARSEGIEMHKYDERPICAAVDALALLHVAEAEGLALSYVVSLLSAHFENGADTAEHGVLRGIAAQVGLSAAETEEALRPDSKAQAWVWAEDRRARRELRVGGVPHYALSLPGQPVLATLEGAQPPEAWLAAFAKLRRAAGGGERAAAVV
jgi:predicted DsbA family dithiol-disulfide isomerase